MEMSVMCMGLKGLEKGSVVCTVFYAVVMSVLGSVVVSVSWPSDNYLSWFYVRIPVLCFALAAVLFYTKVFCDDLRSRATDGNMLIWSCLSWVAFVVQMATVRNLSLTIPVFMIGVLILTLGMLTLDDCKKYVWQNLGYVISAFVLWVAPDPWKHDASAFLVGYSVANMFSCLGRYESVERCHGGEK